MYSKVSQLYIPYTTLFILFFFLTMLSGMQDLSFPNRDQTPVSCIAGRFFTAEPPGDPIYRIDNKNILNSTGNSIQYSVMTYPGRESEKSG